MASADEHLRWYITYLYQNIPSSVYEGLLLVFCLGTVLILASFGYKKGARLVSGLLMAEYVFLLFYKTVLSRSINVRTGYDFHPFWSYTAIREGTIHLLSENIMNVVAFVPVGILMGCVFRNMKWWKLLIASCCLSVAIETLQLAMKKGFAETDDVMHNVIGGMIGYGFYSLVRSWYERIGNRSV